MADSRDRLENVPDGLDPEASDLFSGRDLSFRGYDFLFHGPAACGSRLFYSGSGLYCPQAQFAVFDQCRNLRPGHDGRNPESVQGTGRAVGQSCIPEGNAVPTAAGAELDEQQNLLLCTGKPCPEEDLFFPGGSESDSWEITKRTALLQTGSFNPDNLADPYLFPSLSVPADPVFPFQGETAVRLVMLRTGGRRQDAGIRE